MRNVTKNDDATRRTSSVNSIPIRVPRLTRAAIGAVVNDQAR